MEIFSVYNNLQYYYVAAIIGLWQQSMAPITPGDYTTRTNFKIL